MVNPERIEEARLFIQKKAGIIPANIWTFGEFQRMAEYMAEFAEEILSSQNPTVPQSSHTEGASPGVE